MKVRSTRFALAAAVASIGLAGVVVAAPAGAGANPVVITGTAACGDAMGVPEYTLNWTLTNNAGNSVNVLSATETGAFSGDVDFTPDPVPAQSAATGSDGPVPGDTEGVVTLTVVYTLGENTVTSIGTITLTGCEPPPSSSTSSSSTSSTTTSTIRPSTTVRAATVTPAFTG